MAEEAARLEPPGSEEDGEQKLGTTSVSAEDSSLPPAPDVTYDATILESQNGEQQGPEIGSPEIAQWEREGGQDAETAVQESAIGSSASQEKTVGLEEGGREQRGERTEGDGKSEDDNNGRGEKEEWMDILGSGELKKKVHNMYSCMRVVFSLASRRATLTFLLVVLGFASRWWC